MYSQTVEYALRAIVTLAHEEGRPMVTSRIAEATDAPLGYLYKVLQLLGRSNLVKSQRGSKGGFILTRPAADITLLEIINAVEQFKRIRRCPMEQVSENKTLCPLHKRIDDAMAKLEQAFAETTVDELLCDAAHSYPLCIELQSPPESDMENVSQSS